ncbi:hypothetical protein ACIQD2_15405 [Dietzia maris]
MKDSTQTPVLEAKIFSYHNLSRDFNAIEAKYFTGEAEPSMSDQKIDERHVPILAHASAQKILNDPIYFRRCLTTAEIAGLDARPDNLQTRAVRPRNDSVFLLKTMSTASTEPLDTSLAV